MAATTRSADPATDSFAGWLAMGGAVALIASAFLPWAANGAVALDLSLIASDRPAPPTLGMVLILLAALPAVAALTSRRGWPRTVSAIATAALGLGWLALGSNAALVSGVWVALGATVTQLLAAALAD